MEIFNLKSKINAIFKYFLQNLKEEDNFIIKAHKRKIFQMENFSKIIFMNSKQRKSF
jgi:hypothetical protein